ncbi:stem-specific protein TSJT1 [Cinnamomum micranthum f. kanehirae]|uniref:Stem-specific protein TSJT1 n=1 Tax=Cinnamomum micranthum f. kanehirae TaxID=337451 RepID=A0A443NYG6_9MAGN|nr:stem-specific protein TSJT1 [Cinnamomum micranthum f. kanehirae]
MLFSFIKNKFAYGRPIKENTVNMKAIKRSKLWELIDVKDEIFCLFERVLDNLGSLTQQYGLSKIANEVMLVIKAYKTRRGRAPYPPNHFVGHLVGNFAFVVFDKTASTLFVASDTWRGYSSVISLGENGPYTLDGLGYRWRVAGMTH